MDDRALDELVTRAEALDAHLAERPGVLGAADRDAALAFVAELCDALEAARHDDRRELVRVVARLPEVLAFCAGYPGVAADALRAGAEEDWLRRGALAAGLADVGMNAREALEDLGELRAAALERGLKADKVLMRASGAARPATATVLRELKRLV